VPGDPVAGAGHALRRRRGVGGDGPDDLRVVQQGGERLGVAVLEAGEGEVRGFGRHFARYELRVDAPGAAFGSGVVVARGF